MNDVLTFLGLAYRARKLEIGEQQVSLALRRGSARLCLLASDASDNTKRKVTRSAEELGVQVIALECDKGALGFAFGRSVCAAVVITDRGFADSVIKKLGGQSG